jgi:clan AA aspartic protease
MGSVYEEITLKNTIDVGIAQRGLITEDKVRATTLTALVDTGAMTLIISEGIRQTLGLRTAGHYIATLANNEEHICDITEPVAVYWKDRFVNVDARVLPGLTEVLLGVIPLEGMDLRVNPVDQKLEGVHGDKVVGMIY